MHYSLVGLFVMVFIKKKMYMFEIKISIQFNSYANQQKQ